MASAAAKAEDTKQNAGPGLVIQLAVLLVLTVLAAGSGWFFGGMLGAIPAPEEPPAPQAGGDHDEPVAALRVFPLETITTNLSDPTEIWVRLELALVFADQPDPELAEIIHQDLLAYLRTVKARQIEGASGFQHLRADLNERARVRSDGRVRQVLIRTIIFE